MTPEPAENAGQSMIRRQFLPSLSVRKKSKLSFIFKWLGGSSELAWGLQTLGAMNAANAFPPIVALGVGQPAAPGQGLGGADTAFADSLASVLSGAAVPPLVPALNPTMTGAAGLSLGLAGGVVSDADTNGIELAADLTGQNGAGGLLGDTLLPGLGQPAAVLPGEGPSQGAVDDGGQGVPSQPTAGLLNQIAGGRQTLGGQSASSAEMTGKAAQVGAAAAQTVNQGSGAEEGGDPAMLTGGVSTSSTMPSTMSGEALTSASVAKAMADAKQATARPADPASVMTGTAANQGASGQSTRPVSAADKRPFAGQAAPSSLMQKGGEASSNDLANPLQAASNGAAKISNNPLMATAAKPVTTALAQGSPAVAEPVMGDYSTYAEPGDVLGSEMSSLEPSTSSSTKPSSSQAQPPSTQIAVQIAKVVPQGIDRFSIQLHPAELGAVDVQLDFAEDGSVSALITAERAETLDMLQRDSRALERSLNNSGLQLESGGLSFSLKQEQNPQGQGFNDPSHQEARAYGGTRDRADAPADAPVDMPPQVSRHRLLDIRT